MGQAQSDTDSGSDNGALGQSKAAQAAARAGLRQQLPATENGHVQAQLDFPLLRCDLS